MQLTGPELIQALERTLGIGVVVDSVEAGPPFSIDAQLFYGAHSESVTVRADSEDEAWQTLAARIAAWRSGNDKQFPMWPGGGGL